MSKYISSIGIKKIFNLIKNICVKKTDIIDVAHGGTGVSNLIDACRNMGAPGYAYLINTDNKKHSVINITVESLSRESNTMIVIIKLYQDILHVFLVDAYNINKDESNTLITIPDKNSKRVCFIRRDTDYDIKEILHYKTDHNNRLKIRMNVEDYYHVIVMGFKPQKISIVYADS